MVHFTSKFWKLTIINIHWVKHMEIKYSSCKKYYILCGNLKSSLFLSATETWLSHDTDARTGKLRKTNMFCAVSHFDVRLGRCCVKITRVASKIHSHIRWECVSNHLLIFREAPWLHLHLKEAQMRGFFFCQSEAASLNPSKAEWEKTGIIFPCLKNSASLPLSRANC